MILNATPCAFEGVTGDVKFDKNGDRIVKSNVMQYQIPNSTIGPFWAFPDKMGWNNSFDMDGVRGVCDAKKCTKFMYPPKAQHVTYVRWQAMGVLFQIIAISWCFGVS